VAGLYQERLAALRQGFPTPVSDPVHDGYVAFSVLRALDRVDALKSQAPILGTPRELDYDAALASRLADPSRPLEAVLPELVEVLDGLLIPSHPRSQVNVIAPPSIASILGVILPSLYNPNLCSDESGRGCSEAEVRVVAMMARLVGYDPATAGGVFTFGGTGTLLYGLKIGLEKALPGTLEEGLSGRAVVLCSEQSHHACVTAAGWLGLGEKQVVRVPAGLDNSVEVAAWEEAARHALARGEAIAAMVGTLGTTDALGLDDLAALDGVRKRLAREFELSYLPHLHADAVIGWAWSVFGDYDFAENPLGFRGRTVRALAAVTSRVRHLPLADSLGIDFHKTGFAPYVSSLFLLKDRSDFGRIARQRQMMPYLYHSGQYHPGLFTLETSRSATGVLAALANLLWLGKEGLRVLLGHAVEMAEVLRERIISRPELSIVNDQNYGPVTLFRAYPPGVDTFEVKQRERHDPEYREPLLAHNELNRRIYRRVADAAYAGRGVAIGFTEHARLSKSGQPICALKSYVLSPFAEEAQMHAVVDHVVAACREEMAAASSAP
jgi:glutamate/tyrosine decarboxylase-like PLP-dependent enzyme